MVANISKICDYLDELYENPKCELNYNKDYELLIATVLSVVSGCDYYFKTKEILTKAK